MSHKKSQKLLEYSLKTDDIPAELSESQAEDDILVIFETDSESPEDEVFLCAVQKQIHLAKKHQKGNSDSS